MYEGEILTHIFIFFIFEWKTSNQKSNKLQLFELQLFELLSQFTIKL